MNNNLNKENNLKVGHVNVRSLLPSFNKIKTLINNLELDILGVSESWLTKNTTDADIHIQNFNFFRVDRETRGGGIGVYIRSDVEATVLDVVENKSESFEQQWLLLKINKVKIGLCIFYRPPNYNALTALHQFEDTIADVVPLTDELIIMGDININLLRHTNVTNQFGNLLDAFNCKQVVLNPTRYFRDKATLIDVIILSDDRLLSGAVHHHDMHDHSDHQLIYCTLNIKISASKPKIIRYRNFKQFNIDIFKQDLVNIPWWQVLDCENVNQKVSLLSEMILALFECHAPITEKKVTRPPSPWFTDALRAMKKHRNNLYSKYKRTKSVRDWEAYKEIKNLFTSAVRAEKKSYIDYVSRTKNSREIWKTLDRINIYSKSKKNMDIPNHLKNPDVINNYFIDSVRQIPNNVDNDTISKYLNTKCTTSEFQLELIKEDEVVWALSQIKSNASGADGISLQMLRLCCPTIIPILTEIFNSCIENSIFPSQWKVAEVIPLPKVSSPKTVTELRPISLLPVLSKVFEKLIYRQIIDYFTENHLLPKLQSGFRKGYSTATALLKVLDDILLAADKGDTSALVLLDYSKAFDTLNHSLLCAKLNHFGFKFKTIQLIRGYLDNRSQLVILDNTRSMPLEVDRGVPQGSLLGPLFFIIFTADMSNCFKECSSHRYADDTQIQISFSQSDAVEASGRLNKCLESVLKYSQNHGLKLNPNKSAIIYFGPAKNWAAQNLNVSINDVKIPIVDEYKNLGVVFDSTLRFRNQVSKVLQKAYINLRNIYKGKDVLNFGLKKSLCEALVLSHLNYCNFVYGPCLDVSTKFKLQKVQNSCIRFIYNLKRSDHVSNKLHDLKWLNISDRQKLHFACFLHKLIKSESPSYLFEKLTRRDNVHPRATRFNAHYQTPKINKAMTQSCFSYTSVKLLNQYPIISQSKNISFCTFKSKLKKQLLHINNSR